MHTTAPCFTILTLCFALWSAPAALAQDDDNAPPIITNVTYRVFGNLTGNPFGPFADPRVFTPATDKAREFDLLEATITIVDPDWGPMGDQEAVYLRFLAFGFLFQDFRTPAPPPVTAADEDFFPEDGIAPDEGVSSIQVVLILPIPDWVGKNQARLRGLIDYDVRWLFEFAVSNDQDPDCVSSEAISFVIIDGQLVEVGACGGVVGFWSDFIEAIENEALSPPNPPPFADAGADATVAAGDTVMLDGTRTFEGFNVGFDVESANVFEKDTVVYTWEWISGPERVEPIYRDLTNKPAIAEVTLNTIGTYVYRLVVDDGVNRLPTADRVAIEVVSAIPVNRPPTALIDGPAAAVVVGSLISLDGTSSFDPDGDVLSFRWKQTDELGGEIPTADISRFFQPASGLESPIAVWQAVEPGTFHFRLLVSDGSFSDSERIAVEVIEAPTAGATATNNGASPGDAGSAQDTSAPGALPACGAGMLPIAVVPLCVLLMRRRHG